MLYLIILLNFSTLFLVIKKTRSIISPFSIVILFFLIISFITLLNLLLPSNPYFRVVLDTKTKVFILIFTILMFYFSNQLREIEPNYDLYFSLKLNVRFILFLLSIIILIVTIITFIKNNFQMPLFRISNDFESGKGSHYSEYNIPFFTPLSFAANNIYTLLLSFDFIASGEKFKIHLIRNKFFYFLLIFNIVELLGVGLRNVMIWPILIFFFSYQYFNKIKFNRKYLYIIASIFFAFIFIGNFRLGALSLNVNPFSKFSTIQTGFTFFDTALGWILLYFGTPYFNLNAMIMNPPHLTYGLGILSNLIPDFLIQNIVEIPTEPIVYLKSNNLLPYFGFTFRTYFTDFIPDFGYWGALVLGTLIFKLMVWLHNISKIKAKYFKYYISLIPAFLMIPFLNKFSGLVTLLPILFMFLFVETKGRIK